MIPSWKDVLTVSFILVAGTYKVSAKDVDTTKFPDNFLIGAATSAYQIEGAWNYADKGESIWDHLLHREPNFVNGQNGDVACDSFNKYKEDVKALKTIGLTHYRFSVSWPRILPTGYANKISATGVAYYHKLIDELLANKIIPMITLYHWDLPQNLQDLGGWKNPLMAKYFEDFARVVFKEYGNKVKWWITINNPYQIVQGYGGDKFAPKLNEHGVGDYLAAKTLLLAHAKVYRLYKNEFKSQNGKIGIALNSRYYLRLRETVQDNAAAVRAMEFELGLFAHPIFSKKGDWPQVVKDRVAENSRSEGLHKSRLPAFTEEEIKLIQGTFDFFGLSHYTSRYIETGVEGANPSMSRDEGTKKSTAHYWKEASSPWIKVVPSGFRLVLKYIKQAYGNHPILITENGFSSDDGIEDTAKTQFHYEYLKEMLNAIHLDKCNVIGYTVWSLLDNFSWQGGYSKRFGLVHVDFKSPDRKRTIKKSGKFFQKIIKDKKLTSI